MWLLFRLLTLALGKAELKVTCSLQALFFEVSQFLADLKKNGPVLTPAG